MRGSSWDGSGGKGITQKVMGRVRPDEPLSIKIGTAQKRLDAQINRLAGIGEKLRIKNDEMFARIVDAQRRNRPGYAQAYATELAQVRRTQNMIGGARLSLEQIKLRLETVSELGDVVVTLSPCMSVIRGLAPTLQGVMPEANASMQDLSEILGDVMSGSSVGAAAAAAPAPEASADTLAILEEAHGVIAGKTKSAIPDVPDDLKRQIVRERRNVPA